MVITVEINWKLRENDNGYRFLLGERTIGDVLAFEDERFAVTDTFEPLREGLGAVDAEVHLSRRIARGLQTFDGFRCRLRA